MMSLRLRLYRILWRVLRHAKVGCVRHDGVVRVLVQHQAFPLGSVVKDSALLVGMSLFSKTGSVIPLDPAAWAFHVYSYVLEEPRTAEHIVGLEPATRRILYSSFRDRAVILWA